MVVGLTEPPFARTVILLLQHSAQDGALGVIVLEDQTDAVRLIFEVRDTGIGLAEDQFDSVFDAFTQVDASSTRRHGGSGLGLAIVKELAELMGGQVGVDSRLGEGSTFWFEVGLKKCSAPGDAPAAVALSKGTSVSFFVATSRDGDCQQAASSTLPATARPRASPRPADASTSSSWIATCPESTASRRRGAFAKKGSARARIFRSSP